MAECGFIDPPFTVVKSYRLGERQGREAVSKVELGLESFYKVYRASRPSSATEFENDVFWDPARFRSAQLRSLYSEARRYARLRIPILILGERGTGKTTLASWIRSNSPFRKPDLDRNWPSIVCGQYTPETMRAELFGYKKGSFTGADRDHAGLLTAAHGDTLFLDEVGDVSRDVQRLLIRAVEERKYQPLGSVDFRQSDFRLLAATNLAGDEIRRRLDADFLDRIRLASLTVPALREIREDIPWIWDSVYARALHTCGVVTGSLSLDKDIRAKVLEQLVKQSLPGNMRDLFRVAYRLVAVLSDPSEPVTGTAAVQYALTGVEHDDSRYAAPGDIRAIARAFSRNESLADAIEEGGLVHTVELDLALKSYLAEGIRELANRRGVATEEVCDVSSRTLRNWKQHRPQDQQKNSSLSRKELAGQPRRP
jgi:DNA-binding NtrC family response regulator